MSSPLIFILTVLMILFSTSIFYRTLLLLEETTTFVQQQKGAERELLICTEVKALRKNIQEAENFLIKKNKELAQDIHRSVLSLIKNIPPYETECEKEELPYLLGLPHYQENDFNIKNWPNWVARFFFKNGPYSYENEEKN